MSKSEHEYRCKDVFDYWLRNVCGVQTPHWDDSCEPPDFLLTIEGQEFSVEISRIVWNEPCGDQDLPSDSVQSSLEKFGRGMEDRLIQSGVLKGTYIVEFTAAVQRFGTVKHDIGSQIFNYVGSTNDQKCSSSTELHAEGSTVGRIQKLCDQGEWIEVVGPDNRGGWMNEVEGQVSSLLAERIQSKQVALGKGNCPKPWILVLHDQYALADDSHFVSRLPSIEAANDFHTIIIIRPGIRVLALKNGFPSGSHASC